MTTTTLLTLPHEIKLLVTDHLSPPEKVLLRMTCTHFNNFLHPPSTDSDLLAIETSPYNYKKYTACFYCNRLYPPNNWIPFSHYVNRQVTGWTCGNCTASQPRLHRADITPSTSESEAKLKRNEQYELRVLRLRQGLIRRGFWEPTEYESRQERLPPPNIPQAQIQYSSPQLTLWENSPFYRRQG